MQKAPGRYRHVGFNRLTAMMAIATAAVATASCEKATATHAFSTVLRVGVAQLSATDPTQGLQPLSQILAVENLMRTGEDGRMQPGLAQSWASSRDGRVLTIKLRSDVTFHDGSRLDATTVASLLPAALRTSMGPMFSDVVSLRPTSPESIEITFREASPFLLESLEAPIQKPGPTLIGTGPFAVAPNSTTDLTAYSRYYLGPPAIGTVRVQTYPSIRTAWAEMLRDNLDMLWEVGPTALDSIQHSSNTSVFTFTRRYQHVIAFNPKAPALAAPEIRQALNFAIDRASIVRNALNDYGSASSGPIWPRHWAFRSDLPQFTYDPKRAAAIISRHSPRLRFTCLVSPDSIDERIALEVKRQLGVVGVEMTVEEASREQIVERGTHGRFEAAVEEVISGPTLVRPYLMWHSNSSRNWANLGNSTVDAALDSVRHASSETAYKDAVAGLQHAFMTDPPAIFLAWSVRARAVSTRFHVATEEGRDVIWTVRLWKPATDERQASRH
jgi:peptide/nickel transport system substrate-binding protein